MDENQRYLFFYDPHHLDTIHQIRLKNKQTKLLWDIINY